MKPEEVIALAILPEEAATGVMYARQSLHYTFDRMRYGANPERRFANIAVGKMCEATLLRFLRQHGVPHLSREGATHHTLPDKFDLRVLNEVVDLKTFRAPPHHAQPASLVQCLALIPHQHHQDQWQQRGKYQRFVFGFFNGDLRGRAASKQAFDPQTHIVTHTPQIFYVTAAPSLAECEAQFHEVTAGASCVQYPNGTRIRNMGCVISALPSFQNFLENVEKFCRR